MDWQKETKTRFKRDQKRQKPNQKTIKIGKYQGNKGKEVLEEEKAPKKKKKVRREKKQKLNHQGELAGISKKNGTENEVTGQGHFLF